MNDVRIHDVVHVNGGLPGGNLIWVVLLLLVLLLVVLQEILPLVMMEDGLGRGHWRPQLGLQIWEVGLLLLHLHCFSSGR